MDFFTIPLVYGLYKVLRWAMSKITTAIALVILWKKRARIGTFIDNCMRRIEHGH